MALKAKLSSKSVKFSDIKEFLYMEKVEYNIPITKNKKTKAIKVNIDFYSYLAELNEE